MYSAYLNISLNKSAFPCELVDLHSHISGTMYFLLLNKLVNIHSLAKILNMYMQIYIFTKCIQHKSGLHCSNDNI